MHRLSAILDTMAAILNIFMSYIAGKITFIIPYYDLAIRNMHHFRLNLAKSVGHVEFSGSHFECSHVYKFAIENEVSHRT